MNGIGEKLKNKFRILKMQETFSSARILLVDYKIPDISSLAYIVLNEINSENV